MSLSTVNWIEIPVSDMSRARKFYESLFDFKIVDMKVGNDIYPCFPNPEDDGYWGALVQYDFISPGPKGPLIYFDAAGRMENLLKRIILAGGKIISERQEIAPGFGYFSVFEDTENNVLALQES